MGIHLARTLGISNMRTLLISLLFFNPISLLFPLLSCEGRVIRTKRFIEWGKDVARGKYCSARQPKQCCPDRDDLCHVQILGTLCYCDVFCVRNAQDCCPDYNVTCVEIAPPITIAGCRWDGVQYKPNTSIQNNCNACTCTLVSSYQYNWTCSDEVCLIQPELIGKLAEGNYGWKAANYSMFWGKTFQEGKKLRLGTVVPKHSGINMSSIHTIQREIKSDLPTYFDARDEWPTLIKPVRDQGNCGASWAFSTVDVAADKIAIESKGLLPYLLSPQHLLSCDVRKGQSACEGGSANKAWWFIRRNGLLTEECYPYVNGNVTSKQDCLDKQDTCPNKNSSTDKIVMYITPPYRVGASEVEIMTEIETRGPVQATFEVRDDFFMYKSGVYRHIGLQNTEKKSLNGHLSVRIVGWGEEKSNETSELVKYWICINSWGTAWGEDGTFRFPRGLNYLGIEDNVMSVNADVLKILASHPSEGIRDEGLLDIYNKKPIRRRRPKKP